MSQALPLADQRVGSEDKGRCSHVGVTTDVSSLFNIEELNVINKCQTTPSLESEMNRR